MALQIDEKSQNFATPREFNNSATENLTKNVSDKVLLISINIKVN